MIFDKLIGRSKLSDVLPLLTRVAEENNLRLNRAKEFKAARKLLAKRYNVVSYKFSILLIGILSLSSCCSDDNWKPNPNEFFIKEKCVVVEKWISGRHSDHWLLIRSTTDTTLYTEWNSSDETYWNNEPGDTVYFDYLRKDRFFKKK